MQLSNNEIYKYIKEVDYIKVLLKKKLGKDIKLLSENYSTKHISRPACIKVIYLPKEFIVEITIDTNTLNATIIEKDAYLPLHRYLINENEYNKKDFKIKEGENNKNKIKRLIDTLKIVLEKKELYFYYWEGEKRYKRKGNQVKQLKPGEY